MQVGSLGREDPRRRKWQPTPGFLPGKSHGQRRATVRGVAESDRTEHACMHVTSSRKPFLTLSLDRVSPLPLRVPLFTYCHRVITGGPCLPQACVLGARTGLAVASKAQGERSWSEPCAGLCAPWNRSVSGQGGRSSWLAHPV